MSADKPLSPEVVASPSTPETAGEHSALNKTNQNAAEPSPQGAAPADTPVAAAEPSEEPTAAPAPETA